ncbi:MAG: hypothetical protein UR90_C0018G0008 [Parcubacteria group bacterium GW2011_GWC1_35_8]|uniref:Uncharacterized protein n=2 Tax=Candidatus Nomuraibacteriota TaxID=1752729 RepID=A0A1F6YWL0_9BACT|nr:MAG: hypothetical protein UR90_C0018G0008 [Parcubacteria group bacterium GW2011_GWC1_35_8]KKP88854.1 MAG: hypothetical protein UR91_C0011G0014 [Candidatus Nomurabacteria bacterium GW2011_GWC2_35_8]OGJ06164.1 MAG: hypothetical protein A2238_02370 [Candidatus Nomurabacteria bacterium RIFOXYA2_FULL_35_9]OGJ10725.1 MAG: hypothetical protein A2456_02735 [Candidatus Nomurabacteria bacterium RIFOXYC2_FULL_36_19]OGJ13918.1 MAG: hypothetical protein A2554_02780 [Candidatus Nomurabacteria bacterium RI
MKILKIINQDNIADKVAFTEHEIRQGFKKPVWIPFEKALKFISESKPNNYAGRFIKERDTFILDTAKSAIIKLCKK